MKFTVTTLSFQSWDSRSELVKHLQSTELPPIMLGEDSESPTDFLSCEVSSGVGAVAIGVSTASHGVSAKALLLEESAPVVLVGFGESLAWIDVLSSSLVRLAKLDGVFFDFIPILSLNKVIVVHELGVLLVDNCGAVSWSATTDVITGVHLNTSGDVVVSTWGNTAPIVLSVATGRVAAQ